MNLFRSIRKLLSKPRYILWCSCFRKRILTDAPNAWYSYDTPILWAYAGGGRIHTYGNSKEAIDDSIAHGIKVLELDIAITEDGVPVLTHHFMPGGISQYSQKVPTLNEFLSTPLNGIWTPLSLQGFLEQYINFEGYVSFDPHFISQKWQLYDLPSFIISHTTKEQRSRIIYQVFDLKSASILAKKDYGFASIHYSLYDGVDNESNQWRLPYMVRVMTACNVRSVSMGDHHITDFTRKAIELFRNAGIHVSIAGVDNVARCKEWLNVGADVFNSRMLTPADLKNL